MRLHGLVLNEKHRNNVTFFYVIYDQTQKGKLQEMDIIYITNVQKRQYCSQLSRVKDAAGCFYFTQTAFLHAELEDIITVQHKN
jgi:hypothetical protein